VAIFEKNQLVWQLCLECDLISASLGITIVVAVVVIGVSIYNIRSRMAPPPVSAGDVVPGVSGDGVVDNKTVPAVNSEKNLLVALTPIIPGVPWTAPFYNELAKPVSFPQIKGCIKGIRKNAFKCTCYTQQATVVDVPLAVCLSYVEHHAFNPFVRDRDSYIDGTSSDNGIASPSLVSRSSNALH
jgi:hypothetical protein